MVWCAKIGLKIQSPKKTSEIRKKRPKLNKVPKISEITKKHKKRVFFDGFSKILGFGPNLSSPNHQIQTQWMILLL